MSGKRNFDSLPDERPRIKKVKFQKLVSLISFADLPEEMMDMVLAHFSNDDLNSQLYSFSDEYRWKIIKSKELKHPILEKTELLIYTIRHLKMRFCFSCHHPLRPTSHCCLRTKCQGILGLNDETYNRIMSEIGKQRLHEQMHQEWLVLRNLPKNIDEKVKLALTYGLRVMGFSNNSLEHLVNFVDERQMRALLSKDCYGYIPSYIK